MWCKPGVWQSFTAVYRDPNGWQNIRYADLLINPTTISKPFYVRLRYDVQANRMFLYHPTDDYWTPTGGVQPGSACIIQHTYARLDVAQSSRVWSTETLTVTWRVLWRYPASGRTDNLYLRVEDLQGNQSGWNDHGDWTINNKPSLPYLSPSEGTVSVGPWYEFLSRYFDSDGRQTLDELYLLITTTWARTQNAVYLKYDQSENKMYLRNAADTAWLGPITPKSPTYVTLENEYCILRGDWSRSGAYDSKTLTVRWWLQFKPAFRGTHNTYMRAIDKLGPALNGATGMWQKGWIQVQ